MPNAAEILRPASGEMLPEVELAFAWDGAEDEAWQVSHVRATEALSEPYEYAVELLAEASGLDLRALLGRRGFVRASRGETHRRFHGIARRVERGRTLADGRAVIHVHLVPALWLLTRRTNARVFHFANALEIVRKVLADAGLYPGDALRFRVQEGPKSYRTREYCVQYRESDFAFVSRLLEEEGLTYFFDHEGTGGETLVIADGALASLTGAFPRLETYAGHHKLAVLPGDQRILVDAETIERFAASADVRSTGVAVRDFDFTNVLNPDAVSLERPRSPAPGALTVYEPSPRFVFVDLDDPRAALTRPAARPFPPAGAPPQYDEHSGARAADVAYEALRAGDATFAGTSNAAGMSPGAVFHLLDDAAPDAEREYLVTRVEHEIVASDQALAGRDARHDRYTNRFECIPRATTYRPPARTPRPSIAGVQTATVVGRPGDEIYTDYYGRVKVQFHWDRGHQCHRNDPHRYPGPTGGAASSNVDELCWVRVAQMWAGAGWGTMFVPRVGMEVVVSFVEGDPDRPLIVGCVNNNASVPPYDLPASAHVSTIKTRSTPVPESATAGFNELRFDDARGREEVYIHAERDFRERVNHDHETHVDHDQRVVVQHDQDTMVVGSQSTQVGGEQANAVAGSQRNAVGRDQVETVGGALRQVVSGERDRTVVGNERVVIYGDRSLTVRGKTEQHFTAPMETLIVAPKPKSDAERKREEQQAEGGDDDKIEYLEKHEVQGHRFARTQGLDQTFAEARRARVEYDDRTLVGGQHLVNATEANLLVGDVNDPESLVTGYMFSANKVRVGSTSKDVEDLRVLRGDERLWFQKDKVSLQTGGKELKLEIAGTGCSITLSGDGKTIKLEALESVEIKAGGATLKVGGGISLDAGGAGIALKGS